MESPRQDTCQHCGKMILLYPEDAYWVHGATLWYFCRPTDASTRATPQQYVIAEEEDLSWLS